MGGAVLSGVGVLTWYSDTELTLIVCRRCTTVNVSVTRCQSFRLPLFENVKSLSPFSFSSYPVPHFLLSPFLHSRLLPIPLCFLTSCVYTVFRRKQYVSNDYPVLVKEYLKSLNFTPTILIPRKTEIIIKMTVKILYGDRVISLLCKY